MPFRRITDHLKAHQWLAVVVDLLIVIVGVFIGIEAANWNTSRQDRQEERRYYGQIIVDLDSDLKALEDAGRFARANDLAGEFVLASLIDDAVARRRPGRFASSIVYAGYLYFPRSSRQTYDELISTGNLGLLRDYELKRAISQYYALADTLRQWDALVRQQQVEYMSQTAGLLPRSALRAVRGGREPTLTPAEITGILAKARARPALVDQLTTMAGHQEWIRHDSEMIARETKKLQARLRQHLLEMG